jgi:L-cysteine:1D-myo-inositol 2-amino-2-deoxy-alpha-D-glucopyranoside ligase
MQLYDSRTGRPQVFTPHSNPVTLYVCGITPYDTTHIGHAFTYVMADVLVRYLEATGHPVRYVQNVTDIDDDILRKAHEVGESWEALGNRWTAHYIADMTALNVRPPDLLPRATSVIPKIVEEIEALVEAGLAYVADGSVYYRVAAWPDFGQLSHLPKDEMPAVANERGNRPDAPGKEDPLDFVLWQAQAPGEPAWNSPWGAGRPGWHIECSTLVRHLLGDTIDIHGGGSDLAFPHHECEIAQIEPLTGRQPFARHWFHTAMVRHEGEKMSKSLGNLVMVRDLLQDYTADTLRLYLASHHYRQPWSFDEQALPRAAALAAKLKSAAGARSGRRAPALDANRCGEAFESALAADLNTPAAVGVLAELADMILQAANATCSIEDAQEQLHRLAEILGLRLNGADNGTAPEPRVVEGWRTHLRDFPTPD